MENKIMAAGALFGLIAVILGAFGAHALKELLNPQQLVAFETGVRYQFIHALLLLFVGSTRLVRHNVKRPIFYLIIAGIVCFSGSIYFLTTDNLTGLNSKSVGFITPVGGLLLIIAWLLLFIEFLKKKS